MIDSMTYEFPKASVTLVLVSEVGGVETDSPSGTDTRNFFLALLSPNPSCSGIRLAFSVPPQTRGKLIVCNALGQVVARLWEGKGGPERNVLDWKPGTIPAGVYFLKLESGERTVVRKAVVVK